VGWLSTDYFGEKELRLALAAIPVIYGIVPALLLPIALKLYRAQMERLGSAAD
jgi:hypothetical protein